jgi:hypothetical protein
MALARELAEVGDWVILGTSMIVGASVCEMVLRSLTVSSVITFSKHKLRRKNL